MDADGLADAVVWTGAPYTFKRATDMDIVIADLDTGAERQLLTGAAWYVAGGWSPDGARLLVMRVLDNTNQELLIVDPRTGEAREIASHPQAALLCDRRSAHEQFDRPLAEALRNEADRSREARERDAAAGAGRFVAGEGRHGEPA